MSSADATDDQPGGRDGRDESSDSGMDSASSANLRAALQFVNNVARRRYREQRFTVDNVSVEEVDKLTHELEYYTPPDAPGPIYSSTRISYDAAKSRLVLETRPSIICESLPMFTARSIRDAAGEIVRRQLVQAGAEDPGDEPIFVNWHMPSPSYPFEGRWKGSLREPDEMIGYASDVEMVSDRLMIEGGARCDYASLVDIMKLWLYGSGDDRCGLCLLVTFDEQPRFVMPDVDEVDVAWDWRSAVKKFEEDVAGAMLRSQTDTTDKELIRQPIEYMGHMWLGKLRSWKVETFRKDRDTHNIYVDRQIVRLLSLFRRSFLFRRQDVLTVISPEHPPLPRTSTWIPRILHRIHRSRHLLRRHRVRFRPAAMGNRSSNSGADEDRDKDVDAGH
ncbi:hypothetical protein BZA70DRAFT_275799 [Myxozyma melibiosi]|uniref:Uncharacterized protein n=1 Tax=Myxozyma melibiosi TaxID=54550 RepID=A0ABR1F8H3_9ASCO